ncbi:MAG: DUF5979 domain-containing protein [Promicromonosporaceae bacterium]|nr:DUF5979 domain-containing protein [Promicromonosporaceae bacterium]
MTAGVGAAALAAALLVAGAVPAAADGDEDQVPVTEQDVLPDEEVAGLLDDASVLTDAPAPVDAPASADASESGAADPVPSSDELPEEAEGDGTDAATAGVGAIEVTVLLDEVVVTGGFTIHFTCVKDGLPLDPGAFHGQPAQAIMSNSQPWRGRLDYVATIRDVPAGAVCTVTQEDPGFGATVAITGGSGPDGNQVTIEAGVTAELTVTNTFYLGTVEIVKTLSGPGADAHADDVFMISVWCPGRASMPEFPSWLPRVHEMRVGESLVINALAGGFCSIWPSTEDEINYLAPAPTALEVSAPPGFRSVTVVPGTTTTVIIDTWIPAPEAVPSSHPLAMLPVTGASAAALAWAAAAVTAVGVLLLTARRRLAAGDQSA